MISTHVQFEQVNVEREILSLLDKLPQSNSKFPCYLHHIRSLVKILEQEVSGVDTTSAYRILVDIGAELPIS